MSSFLSVFSRISIVVPSPANVFAITQKSKESKRKVQNATAQKVKKIVKLKWSQNNRANLTNFFQKRHYSPTSNQIHFHVDLFNWRSGIFKIPRKSMVQQSLDGSIRQKSIRIIRKQRWRRLETSYHTKIRKEKLLRGPKHHSTILAFRHLDQCWPDC